MASCPAAYDVSTQSATPRVKLAHRVGCNSLRDRAQCARSVDEVLQLADRLALQASAATCPCALALASRRLPLLSPCTALRRAVPSVRTAVRLTGRSVAPSLPCAATRCRRLRTAAPHLALRAPDAHGTGGRPARRGQAPHARRRDTLTTRVQCADSACDGPHGVVRNSCTDLARLGKTPTCNVWNASISRYEVQPSFPAGARGARKECDFPHLR